MSRRHRQAKSDILTSAGSNGQAQPAPSAKNLITSQDNVYCVGSNGQAVQTADAFSNPLFRLGYGSQSPLEATEYPLTRLTGNYALLNSLYRDNWVVQNVVGLAVDDMLREWYKAGGSISPEYLNELSRAERSVSLRARISDGLRWGRLYGGAVGLILIRGQEGLLDKPLDLETVLPGSFAGLYILDRWSGVTPGMELVADMSDPDFGLPAWYGISSAAGKTAARVHHSRVIRFIGRELPYLEKMAELYWGESEVEAVYRDVVAHDNVSANMAALTFQANINTMEVQNLEHLFSLGSSEQQRRFWNVMQAQSVMRSNFGMQLVNKGDQITNTQYSFAGLSDVYESMCLNLCGASHYPMTKLFGRSPGGMNATGESDLRNYYDYVDTLRESKLRPVLEKLLPIMAMSAWGVVPENLEVIFPPLWTPTAGELAGIAKNKAETIIAAFQANLFDLATAQKELKKLAEETGMFGSISDEDIEAGKGKTAQEMSQLYDPLAGISFGREEASPFERAAQDAASAADYSPDQPRDKNGRWTSGGLQSGSENSIMGLTEAEKYALSKYVGRDSYLINEKLRNGEPLTQEEQQFAEDLDSALEKMPAYQGTVYRSVSKFAIGDVDSFIQSHPVGGYKQFPSYLSSGTAVYDESFPVQYVIQSRTGRDIRSFNPQEGEILFPRRSKFFITKVEGQTIFMEEDSDDE